VQAYRGGWGGHNDTHDTDTNLQGVPEACLLVLDTTHKQEIEGLLSDRVTLVDDFLRREQGSPAVASVPGPRTHGTGLTGTGV
jgi:hypothetical protein